MWFWLVVGITFLQQVQLNSLDIAQQAEKAYTSGDYKLAINLYDHLLDSVQNGDIYFNLGNAYLELGDMGHALVNYLRAAEFIPRDDELRLNLAQIRSQRINYVAQEIGFLENITRQLKETLTTHEMGWLLIFLVWMVCSFWGMRFTKIKHKLSVSFGLWFTSLVLALMLLFTAIRFAVDTSHPPAVVVGENVTVMSGPNPDYLELFVLYSGDEVRVIQRESEWTRIQMPDLREGWIRTELLIDV